jgi:hypothetical protein
MSERKRNKREGESSALIERRDREISEKRRREREREE